MAASVAVNPQEAVGEHAAGQVGPQLALDEVGDRRALLSRVGDEALEVLAYDLVKQGSFGLVAPMLDGGGPSRDRCLQQGSSKFGAASWGVVPAGVSAAAHSGGALDARPPHGPARNGTARG